MSDARRGGSFGTVNKLPSGRYRARYTGPDGKRHAGPVTFETKGDARTWLAMQRTDITRDVWNPPQPKPGAAVTFGAYADGWLDHRTLKVRTRTHYRHLLDRHLLPTFGAVPLPNITAADVRHWHDTARWQRLIPGATPAARRSAKPPTTRTTATLRAHCYGLLRTILADAASDGLIPANPATIRGAGTAATVHRARPASLAELAALVEAMPEHLRALTLLSAWCGLRYGESTELRRRDLDLADSVIRVRRAVVRVGGEFVVGTPKSEAGTRDVAIPPHLLPAVEQHLARFVDRGADALLFPAQHGGHLAPSALYRAWYPARVAAGRPDLRWHDLRHTGAVLAASTGATLAELMARLGHSTPAAALRYQHVARGRDAQIAAALSDLAGQGSA